MRTNPPMYYLLLLPAAAAVAVRDDAPSSLPHITSVQYSGSGCPSSAPGVETSGSGFDDVSFRLRAFAVSSAAGGDGDVYSSTANCEVHVRARGASAGWQVGVSDVYVRGRLVLDPAARMDFYVTTFWSQGAADTVTVHGSLKNTGDSRQDQIATAHGSIPGDQIAWGPCTGPPEGDIGILHVNFRTALLQGGGGGGSGGYGSSFGGKGGDSAVESWDYVWRRC